MAAVLFGAFAWGAIKSAELKTCQACRRTFTVAASAGPQCSECLRTAEERHKAYEWAERERQRIAKEEARRLAAVAEEKKREAKRAAEQMRLDARLKEQDAWLELSPVEFKQGVARLFEREGFIVFVTAQSGDGGIDIELRTDDERRIVQCKRYSGTVGRPDIQRFYGVLMHEGVEKGYFVTTGTFSVGAVKFSENKPIVLIDMPSLMKLNRGTLSIT